MRQQAVRTGVRRWASVSVAGATVVLLGMVLPPPLWAGPSDQVPGATSRQAFSTSFDEAAQFCWDNHTPPTFPAPWAPWPYCWKLDEEILTGYDTGLAETGIERTGNNSLLYVWANKLGAQKLNHANTNRRLTQAEATGQWTYSLSARNDAGVPGADPQASGHTGPEFGIHNTRLCSDVKPCKPRTDQKKPDNENDEAAIQYLPNIDKWQIWVDPPAGDAHWESLDLGDLKLVPGEWYDFVLTVDFDKNEYISLAIRGQNIPPSYVHPLSGIKIGRIPDKFAESGKPEGIVISLEADNISGHGYKVYYDNISVAATGGAFMPTGIYAVGNAPKAVASGDFNKDGLPDLIVANSNTNTITVLRGNLSGGFEQGTVYTGGVGPNSIALGDFNRDGLDDAVTADSTTNTVTVMMQNPDGGFLPVKSYPVGVGARSITVADVTGDGLLDVLTANNWVGSVSLLEGTGNGAGPFKPARDITVGRGPAATAVGDFDGDGILDFAVVHSGETTVMVMSGMDDGSGQRKFIKGSTYQTGLMPVAIVSADFNGDGKTDLAFVNRDSNSVSVYLGTQVQGTLQFKSAYGTGNFPQSIAATDVDGDGKWDLVVSNSNSKTVGVLLGNGDGTFRIAVSYPAGDGPRGLALADFNHDGRLDIAVTNEPANTVSTLLGGSLVPPLPPQQRTATTTTMSDVASPSTLGTKLILTASVSDTNATGTVTFYDGTTALGTSGIVDGSATLANVQLPSGNRKLRAAYSGDGRLLASSSATLSLAVTAMGSQGLTPTASFATLSSPTSVVAWDLDKDGCLDLAVANRNTNMISILWSNCDGTFLAPVNYYVGNAPNTIAVGDFNRDGSPDLVAANGGSATVSLVLGDGQRKFHWAVDLKVGMWVSFVAVGDFNQDGFSDIATANYYDNNVSILLGHGDGNFDTALTLPTGNAPYALTVGDFDGDGKADLAVANGGPATMTVFTNWSGGTFQRVFTCATGWLPFHLVAGDLNGDGQSDLVVANYASDSVSVYFGQADGSVQFKASYAVGSGPKSVAIGDINGDAKLDLITTNYNSNNASILYGNGDQAVTFGTAVTVATGVNPWSVTLGDFDHNGTTDAAVANYGSNTVSILRGTLLP